MVYVCLHSPLLRNRVAWNTSCSFYLGVGEEFGLMDASKLHYMRHVRLSLSSVPSICGERRREQNRGWSQGNQGLGEGGGEEW